MPGKGWLALVVCLVFLPAAAFELSGSFSSGLTFGTPSVASWNTLDLRLSFSGWELRSSSIWQNFALAKQSFTLAGDLGGLGIEAEVVLIPLDSLRLAPWPSQEFRVAQSFLALELTLGKLQLKLVIQTGPDGP